MSIELTVNGQPVSVVVASDTPLLDVLRNHLETCVADAFREGRAEKTVAELAEIFNTARK